MTASPVIVDGHVPRRRHRQTAGRLALHHGIIRVVAAEQIDAVYDRLDRLRRLDNQPEMALRMDSRFSGSKTCFFFGMSSSSAQQAVQQAGVGHGERVAPFKQRARVVQPVARHGDLGQIEQPRAVAG